MPISMVQFLGRDLLPWFNPAFPNSQTLNSSPQAHLGSLGYTVPSWQKPLAGSKERISSLDGQQTQALLVTCFLGSGSQVPPRGDTASEIGPISRDARFLHDFPAHTSSSLPRAGGPPPYWPLSSLLPAPGGLPVKTDTQTHRLQKHGTLEGQPVESTPV